VRDFRRAVGSRLGDSLAEIKEEPYFLPDLLLFHFAWAVFHFECL
jgi:hypothetical protein